MRHLEREAHRWAVSKTPIPDAPMGLLPRTSHHGNTDSDYDETESEEIVEHKNSITRSGRQIEASMRFDLSKDFEILMRLLVYHLVEQAINTSIGSKDDAITLIRHIVEDQNLIFNAKIIRLTWFLKYGKYCNF